MENQNNVERQSFPSYSFRTKNISRPCISYTSCEIRTQARLMEIVLPSSAISSAPNPIIVAFLVIIEGLRDISKRNHGLLQLNDSNPSELLTGTTTRYPYVPSIVILLCSILWSFVVADLKRLEPRICGSGKGHQRSKVQGDAKLPP